MQSFAVVGFGNNLLRDDGVGIHALEYFSRDNPFTEVTCIDAGTLGLALMDRLCHRDGLVALDAMRLNKVPGAVTVLEGAEMDAHLRHHHGSVHELGLSDLMDALRLTDDLPPKRALIGIEPGEIDWGTEPTAAVNEAIPLAVARLRALLGNWLAAPEAAA